jgi:hypothetical protein
VLRAISVFFLTLPISWQTFVPWGASYVLLMGIIANVAYSLFARIPLFSPVSLVLGILAALLHIGVPAEFEVWPWHRLLLCAFWGSTAGPVLIRLVAGLDRAALQGWILACVPGLVAAAEIARLGRSFVNQDTGEWLRMNPEIAYPIFGGLLTVGNVVIGVVPPTLIAVSLLPIGWALPLALKWRVTATIVGLVGLIPSLALATRTPLFAAACVILAVGILGVVYKPFRKAAIGVPVIFLIGFVVWLASGWRGKEAAYALAARFDDISQAERIGVALEALKLLGDEPLGGSMGNLSVAKWAHNMLLDVALAANTVAALLLLALLAWTLRNAIRVSVRNPQTADLIMLSLFMTVGAAAMTMPPHDAFGSIFFLAAAWFDPQMASARKPVSQTISKATRSVPIMRAPIPRHRPA